MGEGDSPEKRARKVFEGLRKESEGPKLVRLGRPCSNCQKPVVVEVPDDARYIEPFLKAKTLLCEDCKKLRKNLENKK